MARLVQVDSILHIPAANWDALCATGQPFVRHGFLAALEAGNSVGESNGWIPAHCLLENDDGQIVAAAPLYEKHHSYGEFVFDFAWANAYAQVGLDYYPKLLNAVPFTPVCGPRILGVDTGARRELAQAMAALPGERGASSLHSLFVDNEAAHALRETGACARRGCQYRWYNRGYTDFEAFLSQLSSKRRKEIRRERKRMHDASVHVRVLRPDEIDDDLWNTLYAFYGRTYAIRGQAPYLTRAFFNELCARMPDQVRFFVAYHRERPVGMAFMMLGDDTLYGRHWGCETDYHSLHFETCYYAGIEYCIQNGLACFDAGAQGEHKIRRGFEPVATWSYHVIADQRLATAIDDFCVREAQMMKSFEHEQRERSNFAEPAHSAS
jgi:predicted N-acyltransferase